MISNVERQSGEFVLPSEIILFHLLVVLGVLGTAGAAHVGPAGFRDNLVFVLISLALYWSIRLLLRKPNYLRKWWEDQVRTAPKKRFSAGVAIILLDSLHLLLSFFALFFIVANLLYGLEFSDPQKWRLALSTSLGSVGFQSAAQYSPVTDLGRLLLAGNSLLGLVFTALWVAVFTKAFDAVFRYE